MRKPKHIAIIMDGNGRWGIKKKNSRNYGHARGLKTVENILRKVVQQKIPYLTLFSFSTENWRRPKNEIRFLFNLIKKYFYKNLDQVVKQGIKIKIIGQMRKFPANIRQILSKVEDRTKKNKKINLILALNYGSKDEILGAFKRLIKKRIRLSYKNFENELYTAGIPDPDLLIRTGGKKRLSNFLLWQLAYTELFFVEKMWPDFNEKDLMIILKKFGNIKRNFGKI